MFRKTLLAATLFMAAVPVAGFAQTGPSSSQSPYINPLASGVEFTSILTVGDAVPKRNQTGQQYRMVGIPDGLGAFDNFDGTVTVLMNHELRNNNGVPRAHGGAGAFVSKWQIRKRDLKVLNGEDLMKKVMLMDPIAGAYTETAGVTFSRFCSSDLSPRSALFNPFSFKGFIEGRIYMNGEEDSAFGRAMAHVVGGRESGTSYELEKFGRHAWENLLANPFPQNKTVVAATEDGGLNKVFFYVGEKQNQGLSVERAGLTNGSLFELKIDGYTNDDPVTGFRSGTFSLASSGGTSLARPEDGAWDTLDPRRFYFVTTASITGNSRLWRMTFQDITNPAAGGTIEVLVDGAAVPSPQIKMMDNITVDSKGTVYMQEDVGNNPRLGQIWKYDPGTDQVTDLGQHDPNRFDPTIPNNPSFLTQDEESSGVIDVTSFFWFVPGFDAFKNRYFLLDVQAHYAINSATPHGFTNPDELVEGGQLLLMKVPRETPADYSEELLRFLD